MSRARKPAPPPQGQLFGPPPPRMRDEQPVELPMTVIGEGTDKAWLLAPLGAGSGKAAFAPRSLVKRAPEPRSQFFTMPRYVAAERGWL